VHPHPGLLRHQISIRFWASARSVKDSPAQILPRTYCTARSTRLSCGERSRSGRWRTRRAARSASCVSPATAGTAARGISRVILAAAFPRLVDPDGATVQVNVLDPQCADLIEPQIPVPAVTANTSPCLLASSTAVSNSSSVRNAAPASTIRLKPSARARFCASDPAPNVYHAGASRAPPAARSPPRSGRRRRALVREGGFEPGTTHARHA